MVAVDSVKESDRTPVVVSSNDSSCKTSKGVGQDTRRGAVEPAMNPVRMGFARYGSFTYIHEIIKYRL